jgi:hypothetical protein
MQGKKKKAQAGVQKKKAQAGVQKKKAQAGVQTKKAQAGVPFVESKLYISQVHQSNPPVKSTSQIHQSNPCREKKKKLKRECKRKKKLKRECKKKKLKRECKQKKLKRECLLWSQSCTLVKSISQIHQSNPSVKPVQGKKKKAQAGVQKEKKAQAGVQKKSKLKWECKQRLKEECTF